MDLDTLSSVSKYTTQTANNKNQQKTEAGTSKEVSNSDALGKRAFKVASVYIKTDNTAPAKQIVKPAVKNVDSGGAAAVTQKSSAVDENEINTERNNETLDKVIAEVNEKLIGSGSECQYSVHKQTGLINIKVYNSETKELLREIPPVKRLDALAKIWELAGLLIDTKG